MVTQWLDNWISCQADSLLQLDVGRGGTYLHNKLTGSDVPLSLSLVAIVSELFRIEFYLYGLALARL